MAQKFPRDKASTILAEAAIFGDAIAVKRWGISSRTLLRYRDRATCDPILSESVVLKTRMLLVDWQQDATKCLKVGLSRLTEIIPQARTEEDGKVIYAIAGAMKIVGELKIAHDALTEPTDLPVESRELVSSR